MKAIIQTSDDDAMGVIADHLRDQMEVSIEWQDMPDQTLIEFLKEELRIAYEKIHGEFHGGNCGSNDQECGRDTVEKLIKEFEAKK